ncbi:RsmF rRNA methyltransferase first C-terminal domain-containing protein [Deinococcus roseus]|uniref:Ribosomal RNA small subunit methyltransferase F n=1 Tax=Deinococcus roseus TaxID=392414 RepID=A0ABQ2DH83_9DEIO|nr:RsmF rRNA methyltransferase first C-terminal domain-containing protein [Deinococcus roseus]GGJ57958.1 ribosomal RNA small subunit methyltransferase F [Deinococcus roseus]
MHLPEAFESRMQRLLGQQYPEFRAALEQERALGLRINPARLTPKQVQSLPFLEGPVPWTPWGHYYASTSRPSAHPFFLGGGFYLQEPSAMAVAELAAPKPGQWVIDLCAAPGGKTTHLASFMQGQGVLVANEFTASRVPRLLENVERWGARTTVLSNPLDRIARKWERLFDVVVLDAPCSGEGMFRKDPEALSEWRQSTPERLGRLQQDLIEQAAALTAPEGTLVYSTCTFSEEENEQVIEGFLKKHPEFQLASAHLHPSFSAGFGLPEAARLFPHKLRGEGHFMAKLIRTDGEEGDVTYEEHAKVSKPSLKAWEEFRKAHLQGELDGVVIERAGHLYLVREHLPSLAGLKAPAPGIYLGEVKFERFVPAKALAHHLNLKQVSRPLEVGTAEAFKLEFGESVPVDAKDGWHWLHFAGVGFTWGVVKRGNLKPTPLRA